MNPTIKATLLNALGQHRGDNYERASHAFMRFSPTEMQEPHGESGQTRQQILDGYRQHARDVQSAIDWVKQQ